MIRKYRRSAGRAVLRLLGALFLALCGAASVPAATNDDNVEWFGVFSHPGDRTPEYPRAGQAFTVDLRVFRGDITGARVRTWDGVERFFDMVWVRNDGPYDVWRATVATRASAEFLYYRFEITDGADTDWYNALGMWDEEPPHGDFFIALTELGRFPLGATPDGTGAVFRVWAPNAVRAAVAGTFNGWSTTAHPMRRVASYWEVRVPQVPHASQYKFVFENPEAGPGLIWRTDPRARAQTNSTGNSVVWRSRHVWRDTDWVTPPLEDLVIYELHVGTFSGEGDGAGRYPGRFRDVVDLHLDHLVELGVNAIELMPICEFAGDRSWGYNPSFLYAPESAYGNPDDLRYLVDRCHRAGIAVLLDVVYNHMGASDLSGNILEYDGEEIYFYPPGSPYRETPWGPRLDYGRRDVREFLRDNVRYWLEEFHIDGFRLDGTDFIKVNAEGWELLKDIARTADTVSPRAVVIAEQLPDDPAVTLPIAEGGAGADAQWNDAFHDALRAAIKEAAFGDPDVGAVARGMEHTGFPGARAVNYIESHDEARDSPAPDVGRVTELADASDPHSEWAYGRAKLALGLVLFSAGVPMLLQGQEFMEDRGFGDAPSNRIQWSYRERYSDFFLAARDMIRLRRTLPALRGNAPQNIFHVNDGANVIAWHRWTPSGDDLIFVASFNNADFDAGALGRYRLGFPYGGEWFEIFNSDAAAYGGRNRGNAGRITASGPPLHGFQASADIVIPRMGVLVFAREPVVFETAGFRRGDCNGDDALDISDAIRILLSLFAGEGIGDCAAACDANGDGALDVSDAVYLLGWLFRDGSPPPDPGPDRCGPAAGGLSCERTCN